MSIATRSVSLNTHGELAQSCGGITVAKQHAKKMRKDENMVTLSEQDMKKIYSEFREVRKRHIEKDFAEDALKSPNKSKNRYGNVIPFEKTAVKLKNDGHKGSEYINASHVKGKASKLGVEDQCYICCQAPLPKTFGDFWRMVWEQNASVILMLTKTVERGNRVKAHVYWPEEGKTQTYGKMRVQCTSVKKRGDLIIVRKFLIYYQEDLSAFSEDALSSSESEDEEFKLTETVPITAHEATQIQFVGWPDFGVPTDTNVIYSLIRELDIRREQKRPVVCHCSAGIGRTGTFVAIHMLVHEAQRGAKIDVKDTVLHLRSQRVGMVQNKDQYNFIYVALSDILKQTERRNRARRRQLIRSASSGCYLASVTQSLPGKNHEFDE
mmetsp:Transcript_7108/g.7796  ORF Transcript_7108/g.7796 Transcript_7108/m.7796 type:complete len:381 (+) Transcript_7108:9-1151(+)